MKDIRKPPVGQLILLLDFVPLQKWRFFYLNNKINIIEISNNVIKYNLLYPINHHTPFVIDNYKRIKNNQNSCLSLGIIRKGENINQ